VSGWFAAFCECRVCPDGARHVAVFPEECDAENMECPRCHAMACQAVEYIENAAMIDARPDGLTPGEQN